jgi:hypothetical protein
MARILRTYGQGWGSTDAAVTIKFDDQIVFSGTVPTKPERPYRWQALPEGEMLLFEFEIPLDTVGTHVMQYEMLSGIVTFSSITSNFVLIPNPVWSADELDLLGSNTSTPSQIVDLINSKTGGSLTQEQIDSISNDVDGSAFKDLLAALDLSITVRSAELFDVISPDDPRTAVTIDGSPSVLSRTPETLGTWYYSLQAPQIMQFNLDIPDIST